MNGRWASPSTVDEMMIEIGKMLLDGSEIIFKPPCPCEECSEQYIPPKKQQVGLPHWFYTGTLDDVWADLLARKFCLEIFEHLHLVRNTVLSHGRLVQRRWLKKSNTKRKSFLKQLRPEMIENEKAVLDMNNEFLMDPTLSQNHRKTFMLPYLNIETLSKDGSRMLRLVHYRVSHHPADWAPFDNQQLLSGWFLGAFTEEFNSGCMTISREEYGVWKPFDGAKVHAGNSYGAPRALLILEAQAVLVTFLRDFVTSVCANVQSPSMLALSGEIANMEMQVLEEPPKAEDHSWMQFGVSYYNEPFSPPPVFDDHTINQLIEVAVEKQAEAEDNLWLLQSDPTYFLQIATYWNEHNPGTVARANISSESMRHQLADRMVRYSVTQAQDWQMIAEELQHVRAEYEAHRDEINPGEPLPVQYDRAVGGLLLHIITTLDNKARHLLELAFVSPAWKSMWRVDHQYNSETQHCMEMKDGCRVSLREIYRSDHILWCIFTLTERPGLSGGNNDVAATLRSLDTYLANCNKSEANKIDSITYNRITDLAAMYRILSALRMHRPSISPEHASLSRIAEYHDSRCWRLWRHSVQISRLQKDLRRHGLGHTVCNLEVFRMPGGKKNLKWLERAGKARAALSRVWSAGRDSYKYLYQATGMTAADTEDVLRLVSYDQSPEFQHMLKEEKDQIRERLAHTKTPKNVHKPYESLIPHVPSLKDTPQGPSHDTITKQKIKTRPANTLTTVLNTQDQTRAPIPIETPAILPPLLPLPLPKKAKSLATLRLLFPTAISDFKGTIQWPDFIITMSELGFQGEHRGGLEWTFRSLNNLSDHQGGTKDQDGLKNDGGAGDGGGVSEREKQSIVIHQPHPEQRIGAVGAQWIGKRLWRRFGWSRERFEGL